MWKRHKHKRGAWQDISDKKGILLLGEEKNSQLFDAEKVTLPNVPRCWVLSFIWQFVSKTFYPTRTFSLADSPSQTFVFFRKVGKTFIRSPPYNFCRCMIETLLYSKYLGKAIVQEIQFTQIVSGKAVLWIYWKWTLVTKGVWWAHWAVIQSLSLKIFDQYLIFSWDHFC